MEINDDYTIEDHNSRDEDSYALLKYKLTLQVLQRLSSKEHLSILEVGCGSGLFTSMAISHGYSIYAIEPDPASLALAKIRNNENRARLENVGVFEFMPKNKFDVVVMHDVLEHIEEDSKAVEKVGGFLKAGGTLIISVPAHQYLFGYHDVQLGHFRRYSKKSLQEVLGKHFKITHSRFLGALGIPAALLYSRFLQKPYPKETNKFSLMLFNLSLRIESVLNLRIGSSLLMVAISKK